jgi:hypothetical protein
MSPPRPEEFILDVRRALRLAQRQSVSADSPRIDIDAMAHLLQRADLWLTPKVVENYHPEDFANLPEALQLQLQQSVEAFRSAAATGARTQADYVHGVEAFRQLTEAIKDIVLTEWMNAVNELLSNAEAWAGEMQWTTRRVNKTMQETVLGEYQIPQLQFFAEQQLYLLDPVARFVPGALGAVDLAIQPSYYVSSIYRYFDEHWYVHLDVGQGIRESRGLLWNKGTFLQAVAELRSLL